MSVAGYAGGVVAVALATGLAAGMAARFAPSNLVMVYLLEVLIARRRPGAEVTAPGRLQQLEAFCEPDRACARARTARRRSTRCRGAHPHRTPAEFAVELGVSRLRTPLAPITGAATSLLGGELAMTPDARRELLGPRTRCSPSATCVDQARREVRVAGKNVHLTPIEHRLLTTMVRHAGKVLTHRQLLREVWGPNHVEERTTCACSWERRAAKLEQTPAQPRYLLTEPGVGYRLADE